MLFLVFLAVISGVAGLLGGLTGTGGIIMPPLMIALFGVPAHVATAMAQASYILPSLLSVAMFLRKGHFDWKIAAPLALTGFWFSWWAADALKPELNSGGLQFLFALCVILSGAVMLWKSSTMPRTPLAGTKRTLTLILSGAAVGILAGITGSGSNSVLVPFLSFLGFDLLKVLAAGQAFSVLSSFSGTLGNLRHMDLDILPIAVMVATQLVGMRTGVRLAQRTDTKRLKKIVGVVCLAAGLFMALEALPEFMAE